MDWTISQLARFSTGIWPTEGKRGHLSLTGFQNLQGLRGSGFLSTFSPFSCLHFSLDLGGLIRTESLFLVLFSVSFSCVLCPLCWRVMCISVAMNGGPQVSSAMLLCRRNNRPGLCQHGPSNWKSNPKGQKLCGETGGPLPRSAREK